MSRLEDLKEVADRNLGGLKADTRLLHEILNAKTPTPERKTNWRPILAISMAAVLLLVAGVIGLPQLTRYDGDINVVTRSAGGDNAPQTVQLTANVPAGSVNISESAGSAPGYQNLFASGQSANFPLLKVGERTYRMLTGAVSASTGQLGRQLGTVTEFTSEPAISSSAIVSNTVEAGKSVYAINGMDSALLAAEVQGTLRVFQRVSYSGTAVVGAETLKDVLTGGVEATALELSDVGRINDAGEAQALMELLFSSARYEGASESSAAGQSLLIKLANGMTVQMNIKNGTLYACGAWSSPEFFDAFQNAITD